MQNDTVLTNSVPGVDCIDHHVQFYDTERTLSEAVAEFIESGVKAGQPVLAIVTPSHQDAISRVLVDHGFHVEGLVAAGQLRWLDARTLLSLFMKGTIPDVDLFNKCLGNLIVETRTGREHLAVRAFGEMVDLLCRDGNHAGATRLEQLWNDLGKTYGFFLMCAYSINTFYREAHWRHYQEICRQHGRVDLRAVVPDSVI